MHRNPPPNAAEIDLHGLTRLEAKAWLDTMLDSLPRDVREVRVVHGYKTGDVLLNYIRKEYCHLRVAKKVLTLNQGATVFELT